MSAKRANQPPNIQPKAIEVGKVEGLFVVDSNLIFLSFRVSDNRLPTSTTDITWRLMASKDEITRELLCHGGIWKPSEVAGTLHTSLR